MTDKKLTDEEMSELALKILILATKDSLSCEMEDIAKGNTTVEKVSQEMFEEGDVEGEIMMNALGKTKVELQKFSLQLHQQAYAELVEEKESALKD